MKKTLFALLCLAAALPTRAIKVEYNGLVYNVSARTASVMPSDDRSYAGDIVVPDTISYSGRTITVRTIDEAAFKGCVGLTSIKMGENITQLGASAFDGCTNLQHVYLAESKITRIYKRTFANCDLLDDIQIPTTVVALSDSAFALANGLTSYVVPASVRTVGANAFARCTKLQSFDMSQTQITAPSKGLLSGCVALTEVKLPSQLTTIPKLFVEGCLSLKKFDLPATITTLGDSAFCNSALESFTFSSALRTLGADVFNSCVFLKSVDMSQATFTALPERTFMWCPALTDIKLPASLTTVGNYAFSRCTSLKTLDLSHTAINTIGQSAFRGNAALVEVTYPASLVNINSQAFYGCHGLTRVDLTGTALTTLGNHVFWELPNLTEVLLPATLTKMDLGTFQRCTGLTSVDLSQTRLTTLPDYTFARCDNLESVKLPNSLTQIGMMAFSRCGKLTAVDMPNTLRGIGSGAFLECSALSDISIPASVDSIAGTAFARSLITKLDLSALTGLNTIADYCFENCTQLEEIKLPQNLTCISRSAFLGCESLKAIEIPYGVTTIGNGAFRNCKKMTEVNLPKRIETIGIQAFSGDSLITSIELPAGVTSIGEGAFEGLINLSTVISHPVTPPTIVENTLSTFDSSILRKARLTVPAGTYIDYKTTDVWRRFVRITEAEEAYCDINVSVVGKGSAVADSTHILEGGMISVTITPASSDDFIESITLNGNNVMKYYDASTKKLVLMAVEEKNDIVVTFGTISGIETPDVENTPAFSIDDEGVKLNAEAGQLVRVYNTEGRLVSTVRADGKPLSLNLQQGNVYIVRVGNKTEKISL